MRDDVALLRAAKARWLLVPSVAGQDDKASSQHVDAAATSERCGEEHERAYLKIALPDGSLHLGSDDLLVGRDDACKLALDSPWVSLHRPQAAWSLLMR